MKLRFRGDRRLAGRYTMKTPLRVRLWKSALPEHTAESLNVSQRGIYFATDSLLHEGETVEVFGKMGVGVQFDCYEVSRSKPPEAPVSAGTPPRMFSEVVP